MTPAKAESSHTNDVGTTAEFAVAAVLRLRGFDVVYGTQNQRFDLLAFGAGSRIWRIQVKTGRLVNRCVRFYNVSTAKGRRQAMRYE